MMTLVPGLSPGSVPFVCALTVLFAFQSCVSEVETTQDTAVQVELVSLEKALWSEELKMGGTLVPHRELELASTAAGRVQSVPLREGEPFKRGSLLVILENPTLVLERDRSIQRLAQSRAACELRKQALDEVAASLERRLASRARERASRDLAYKRVLEGARKLEDLERLCSAGAVSVEGLKNARHAQACLEEELSLLDLSLAEGAIGIRMADILAAGIDIGENVGSGLVIGDYGPPSPALLAALVALHSRSLESELVAATALVDAALLELDAAERALSELELRAPFDGRLLSTYVKEGTLLPAGKVLVSIMDDSGWDVVVQVGEYYAAELDRGLGAVCRVPAVDLDFPGTLDLVAGRADRSSASLPARIRLEGDAPVLRPGLYSDISLTLPSALEQKVLPRSSVRSTDGATGICYELIGTQVYERQLRLGQEREGSVAVLSGLRDEALVVRTPAPGLKGGDHVTAVH